MIRADIRDNRSPLPVKPRVLDLIIKEDGLHELEVKDGKVKKTILLTDLQNQISRALQTNKVTTEPVSR